LNAEIEKERQSKEQLFLKWLRPRIIMTSEKNVTSKSKRNVTKEQKRILGQGMFRNIIIFRE